MNKKIIVSMTSYPKRIMNVAKCAFALSMQTVRPDEIHLWLAKTEFSNKEKDLPKDLQLLCDSGYVILHWLDNNTFCFKRHEIFRLYDDPFYCFFIDDDVIYQNNLIESTLKLAEQHPNCIINYTDYGKIGFNGKHQIGLRPPFSFPTPKNRWCGQSMIPSWIIQWKYLMKKMLLLEIKYVQSVMKPGLHNFL